MKVLKSRNKNQLGNQPQTVHKPSTDDVAEVNFLEKVHMIRIMRTIKKLGFSIIPAFDTRILYVFLLIDFHMLDIFGGILSCFKHLIRSYIEYVGISGTNTTAVLK